MRSAECQDRERMKVMGCEKWDNLARGPDTPLAPPPSSGFRFGWGRVAAGGGPRRGADLRTSTDPGWTRLLCLAEVCYNGGVRQRARNDQEVSMKAAWRVRCASKRKPKHHRYGGWGKRPMFRHMLWYDAMAGGAHGHLHTNAKHNKAGK